MPVTYRIVLALHLISLISWMAGLLYLYRLFVYFAEETVPEVRSRFLVMQTRLYKYITMPAMLATIVFGLLMLFLFPPHLKSWWLHAKLACVFGLIGMTHMGSAQIDHFSRGLVKYSPKTYRILNEVPTVLMIIIVFLAILKPGQ